MSGAKVPRVSEQEDCDSDDSEEIYKGNEVSLCFDGPNLTFSSLTRISRIFKYIFSLFRNSRWILRAEIPLIVTSMASSRC